MDKVIGFASQMQMGKTTSANLFVEKKKDWTKAAFAFHVKRIFCEHFNVDNEFLEKWKTNPLPPPGFLKPIRQSMQFIGDGYRTIQGDIWIRKCFENEGNLAIDDCRYFNEIKAVKEKNGFVALIYRPGFLNDDPNGSEAQLRPILQYFLENVPKGPVLRLKADAPEIAHSIDYFIVNDGTLDDLSLQIDDLIHYYELVSK